MLNLDSIYPNSSPEVGTHCTICYVTDSYPAVITRIISPKRVEVQVMDSTIISGNHFEDNVVYAYKENNQNPKHIFSKRKDGRWIRTGEKTHDGTVLSIGHARRRIDPHF